MKPRWTNSPKLWLKGAQVIDPAENLDSQADILIADGKIVTIGNIGITEFDGAVVDLAGNIILPGLFDMHTHFREPGREDAETIETGCDAAILGGFTGVAIMPNTTPAMDNVGIVRWVEKKSQGLPVDVCTIAAVTKGREGKELTEIAEMVNIGVRAFSDDGSPIKSAAIMRRALEYAGMFDVTIIGHEEDPELSGNGVMHEGTVSTSLGLEAIPHISEDVMIARDLIILEYIGGRFHIAHLSSAKSLEPIRQAKAKGLNITVEVTPHHLSMTDDAVKSFHTSTKMNPPLRTEEDRLALLNALGDGTIDVIATDHAPHTWEDKECEYNAAPFGIIGLETALSVVNTYAVKKKILSWSQVVERMAHNPRTILRQPLIHIKEGETANLTVFDPAQSWAVHENDFGSKSRNSPYIGNTLEGKVVGVVRNLQTTMPIEA